MKKQAGKPEFLQGDEIRSDISQGKINEAIKKLRRFCKKHDRSVYNTVLLIDSNKNSNDQKKRRNTISEETYDIAQSKLSESILEVVDLLEGKNDNRVKEIPNRLVALGIVLLVSFAVFFLIIRQKSNRTPANSVVEKINVILHEESIDSNFVVMVLPFSVSLNRQDVSEDNFHIRLMSMLEQEKDIEVLTLGLGEDKDQVITYTAADSIGRANEVDLLLWGEVAYLDSNKDTVGLNIKYLNLVSDGQSSDLLGYDRGQTDIQKYDYEELLKSGQLLLSVENVFNWAIAHKAIKFRLWGRAFRYLEIIFENSIIEQPTNLISLMKMMASMKMNEGYPNLARGILRRALSIDNKNPGLLAQIGNSFMTKDINTDSALFYLNRTIALDPDNHLYYNNRANIYSKRREYDRAIVDLKRELKLDSSFFIAYGNLGFNYEQSGDIEKAIAFYQTAISKVQHRNKNSFVLANYHSQLASLYLRSNNTSDVNNEFISNIGKAKMELDLAKKYQRTRVYFAVLGKYYMRIEKYYDAIEALNAADKIYAFKNKNNIETRSFILYTRGNAYFKLEQYEEALADYENAILIYSTPDLIVNRNRCLRVLNRE